MALVTSARDSCHADPQLIFRREAVVGLHLNRCTGVPGRSLRTRTGHQRNHSRPLGYSIALNPLGGSIDYLEPVTHKFGPHIPVAGSPHLVGTLD